MPNFDKDIDELVERGCGASSEIFGVEIVKTVCGDCIAEYGLRGIGELVALLKKSPEALADFCVRLSVPETWFFRESESFNFLENAVKNPPFCGGSLRILSVPCSIGCEPYSISASLLSAGVSDFEIDAFDISSKLVEKARTGIFSGSYIRNARAETCPYFIREKCAIKMASEIGEHINFSVANVLSDSFGSGIYDIIFCRNLLIYFSKFARKKLFDKIVSLSSEKTLIFTGHADGFSTSDSRFRPVGSSRAFAVQICKAGEKKQTHKLFRPSKNAFSESESSIEKLAKPAQKNLETVADIRALADKGKIDAARKKCATLLAYSPESVDLNLLAAQIASASNDPICAEKYFRRVLYLSPSNVDAALGLKLARRRNSRNAPRA